MSEQQLRDLLTQISRFCDVVFEQKGEVLPFVHAITAAGDDMVMPHPMIGFGKDRGVAILRELFRTVDAERYVYAGEGWILSQATSTPEAIKRAMDMDSIADHPDRIEVVQFQGEDQACGQIMAMRCIVRPEHGKPYLKPLDIMVQPGDGVVSEGRMVGLLPNRGSKQ